MMAKWRQWLEDRFGWIPFKRSFLDRRVGKTPWYYGDGSTLLLLLGVLVVTGPFLALGYAPTPDQAYESILDITRQPLGWFVRALHYWAAGLMVVMLFFHLLRQIWVGGYKFPREGTWLIGVTMFFIVLTMSLLGYTLRWDERAVYGIKVALYHFSQVPFIGNALALFVQGGPELGIRTLTRFYAAHVAFGPLTLLALAGFHLYLVVVHGVTSRPEQDRPIHTAREQKEIHHAIKQHPEESEPFFPDAMAKSAAMAITIFGIVVALALLLRNRPLYPEANLVLTSEPAEEWWWSWYSALIALLPPGMATWFYWAFPVTLFIVLVALPFVDRSPYRGYRKRPIAAAVVVIAAIALVSLTALRQLSPWGGWPNPEPPPIPAGIELAPEVEEGRQLFAQYGCTSCHQVAGWGPPRVGTDLARLEERYSPQELRHYILQPPEGVPMPPYEGRMSDEDLRRIVAFVLVAQTFPRSEEGP
jgi:ubiquinol-cytochrome c reductase cytochrome b subunit